MNPQRELTRAEHAAALEALAAPIERQVAESLRRVMTARLALVHPALVAADLPPLDVNALSGISNDWAAEVDRLVGPMLVEVYEVAALDVWDRFVDAVDRMAQREAGSMAVVLSNGSRSFMEVARNRLVGIGDTAWTIARTALVEGIEAGDDMGRLTVRVREAIDVGEARARTIARTETLSAANAGATTGARVLGDDGPQFKEWLATKDTRTRDTHWLADGQRVPISDPFVVGGYNLDHPGDPYGPAGEVINCRCTVLFVDEPGGNGTGAGRTGRVTPIPR